MQIHLSVFFFAQIELIFLKISQWCVVHCSANTSDLLSMCIIHSTVFQEFRKLTDSVCGRSFVFFSKWFWIIMLSLIVWDQAGRCCRLKKKGIYQLILCDIASAHEDKTHKDESWSSVFFRPMPSDATERRLPLSESPFQHRRKKRRKRRRRTSRTPTEGLFEERLTSAVETSWKYETGNLCGKAVDLFR